MLELIKTAFERQDYATLTALVQQRQRQSPHDPWLTLYGGWLQEVAGQMDGAEAIYRQILKDALYPKLMTHARQGLQRLVAIAQTQRAEAIAQATTEYTGLGVLILPAIPSESKQQAAQAFGRIMGLDPYTARLHLPSRGWRLYRLAAMGELQVYGQALNAAGIPAFWVSLAAIQAVQVFRVQYIQAVEPRITVVCQNEANQLGSLTFSWSDVGDRVEGLLPIFEDVVDLDLRQRLIRKEQTQDYAKVVDLHLPKRRCIVRLCDRTYQFQQGVVFDAGGALNQTTTRLRWNILLDWLGNGLPTISSWTDFTAFADTALGFLDRVPHWPAHLDLFRKEPTPWDPAFHLYSGLVFERAKGLRNSVGSPTFPLSKHEG